MKGALVSSIKMLHQKIALQEQEEEKNESCALQKQSSNRIIPYIDPEKIVSIIL